MRYPRYAQMFNITIMVMSRNSVVVNGQLLDKLKICSWIMYLLQPRFQETLPRDVDREVMPRCPRNILFWPHDLLNAHPPKGSSYEALVDSGNTISSFNGALVSSPLFPTLLAPPVQVLFGDHQKAYHFRSQHTFVHSFYVLSYQLFLVKLGCDWFNSVMKRE